MYVGQTGDVEDFMPEAGRQQEEEVQRPVPHLVTRPTAVLHMKCKHHGTSCITPGCLSDQTRHTFCLRHITFLLKLPHLKSKQFEAYRIPLLKHDYHETSGFTETPKLQF